MIHKSCLFAILCLQLAGCTLNQPPDNNPTQTSPGSIHAVFLTREGCANTPVLLANLKAVAESSDLSVDYEVVDQGTLSPTDARVGYATPTILYEKHDLFGLPEPVPPFPAPS